jgi:SAM-dependent methyltransferase
MTDRGGEPMRSNARPTSVIWHDLECGTYAEDLGFWRELAGSHGGPVLDVGAGTGRVALELCRHGHRVTALDSDREMLSELERRADGFELDTVAADARDFDLGRRFALCVVPMQTIQLLGGRDGRISFLSCARRHLDRGGVVAVAIAEELELYEMSEGVPGPLPDICERGGIVYSSQPTAVRAEAEWFVLERHREIISARGDRILDENVIQLDRLTRAELEAEGRETGFHPAGSASIAPTDDYVGSTVVMLGA